MANLMAASTELFRRSPDDRFGQEVARFQSLFAQQIIHDWLPGVGRILSFHPIPPDYTISMENSH
jgi:hypothetical protein